MLYIKEKISKAFQNEFWNKLVKNVMIVLIGNVGSSIINLFITIIMARFMGNATYGIFLIALQYMNLLDGILNFQSWAGVIKYGSEAIIEKREDKLASIFKCGFIIDIATAICGTIVALMILPIAAMIMKWNSNLTLLAAIFSIEILFHVEGTSIGILRLYNKFSHTAKQAIISAIIKFLLVGIYLLVGGRSILVVTVLYVTTDIIKHLILVVMAISVLKKKMGLSKVARSSLKILDKCFLKYTIWNNVSYSVDVPVKYFDVFIVSMISVDMVSIYKVFKQIIQVFSMLVNPVSQVVLPQFSELVAMKKTKTSLEKVLKLRNVILVAGTIVTVISLIFGKQVFKIILGTEYSKNLLLFEVMFITYILLMSYTAIHPFFAALGVAKVDFIYTVVSNVIYMIISIGLVKYFGIYSIILATGIQGLFLIVMKYRYACQHFVDE